MAARRLPPGVRRRVAGDGTVSYQARWRDASGREVAATFDGVAEATAYRANQLLLRRVGGRPDPSAGLLPLSQWWEQWMTTRIIAPSTRARDDSYAANHILPRWGAVSLQDIEHHGVSLWVSGLAEVVAPATAQKVLQLLRQAMTAAIDSELIRVDRLAKVKPPKIPRIEACFLEPEEVLLLELAMHVHWRLTVPFMVDTGARIGEVAAIRVFDLDLGAGTVRITRGAVYVSTKSSGLPNRRIEGSTKSFAGVRTVPTLTVEVGERLAQMIADRKLQPNDLLFTGPRGGPLNPGNFRRSVFAPAVIAAGLAEKGPTPHALRHTAIAHWIASGVKEPYKLNRWAGHESMDTLYKRYGHLLSAPEDEVREALSRRRRTAYGSLDVLGQAD